MSYVTVLEEKKRAAISYFGVNLKHAAHLSVSEDIRLDSSPESSAMNMNGTSKTKKSYGCNSKKTLTKTVSSFSQRENSLCTQ